MVLTTDFGILYISVGYWWCFHSLIQVSNIPVSVHANISMDLPYYITCQCRLLIIWALTDTGFWCHPQVSFFVQMSFLPDTSMLLLVSGHMREGHPGTIVSHAFDAWYCWKWVSMTKGCFCSSEMKYKSWIFLHCHAGHYLLSSQGIHRYSSSFRS
jgi:hypothetical protein